MADGTTLPNLHDHSMIDPLLLALDSQAKSPQNELNPKFTSIYSSEDTAVEHEGGAPYDGSGLYEQFHSPASQLTSGQPYLTPISTAAATQVNVSIDSSRNEFPFPQVNAEHTESQELTDSDDNGNLSLAQARRTTRPYTGGQINRIELKARLTLGGGETTKMFEDLKGNPSLCGHIKNILTSSWYLSGENEPLLPTSQNRHISKQRVAEASSSVFRSLFSPAAPYQCLICNDGGKGRSLERALGHARGHFGVKIDNQYTNCNTKKDQARRKKNPHVLCTCGKKITVQNLSRHKLKMHRLGSTDHLSQATD